MITVYGSPHSTCTRKVLTTLEEKGASYELRVVDLAKREQKSPEHLARQPFGVVPVIDHDGFRMYESRAIVRYLDRVLPGTSLSPSDAQGAARMDQFVSVEQGYFSPHALKIFFQTRGGSPDAKVVGDARAALDHTSDVIETRLAETRYFAGDSFSLADIAYMPYCGLLAFLGHADVIESRPSFARWWREVSQRPSWKKVAG